MVGLQTIDEIVQLGSAEEITLEGRISGVIGQLTGIDHIYFESQYLQGKDGRTVANITMYDMTGNA